MKEKKKSKFFDSKVLWMIVSLLCSVIIWSYVSGQDQTQIMRTCSNVQVVFAGEDKLLSEQGLLITNVDTKNVTIEVRGSRTNIGELSSSDIKAVIDVSSFTRANGMSCIYDVQFPETVNVSDITVSRRTPHMVNFTIVRNIVKTVDVKGSFEGEIAEGYVADELIFEPSQINVEGPEDLVNNIDSAWVTFGSGSISETVSDVVELTLRDENNEKCSAQGLKLSTDTITATQPVLIAKQLGLVFELIPGGGLNSSNCQLSIEPAGITIGVDPLKADKYNDLMLGSVDLAEISEGFENVYSIPLTDDMKNLTGVTEATVRLTVPETFTRTLKTGNIVCNNVTEGYTAQIDTQEVEVLLRSPDEELLNSIEPAAVSVIADLSDFGTTTGQVMVTASASVHNENVGAIGDVTVTVTISKKEDNAQ